MKKPLISQPVVFITSGILLIVLILSVYYFKSLSVRQNQIWIEFSDSELARTELLQDIAVNIGFGGFIHNYKNAILRKDIALLSEVEKKINITKNSLQTYQTNFSMEKQAVLDIENTLDQYLNKLHQVERYIKAGWSAEEIDEQVKVDDKDALLAITQLISSISGVTKEVATSTISRAEQVKKFLSLIITIVLSLLVIFFIYIMRATHNTTLKNLRMNALFELAPLSILAVSEDGLITTANQVAIDTFKLEKDNYHTINIDQLTPASVSGRHKHYREQFHKTDRTAPMTERDGKFSAQRLNGEIFPASISIMTHTYQGAKEAIVIVKDITEEIKHQHAANSDQLTKLPNRRSIDCHLGESVSRANRLETKLHVALIDIDYFKKINDDYGHTVGDKILIDLSNYLKKSIRETDFVGRWGGEEFLLILENSTPEGAFEVCEKIRVFIASESEKKGRSFTVSIGLAEYEHGRDSITVFEQADEALYLSKTNGRNRTTSI